MVSKVGYDSHVKGLNSATVAALALVLGGLVFLTPAANAQINGTPASVTSTNFGGHLNSTPGVPASVTSLGPNGLQPRNPVFNQPACCNLFPANPNPSRGQRHHHRSGQFFPGGGAVYVPYAYPVVVGESETDDAADPRAEPREDQREDDYRGGPTIFDRRGPGEAAPYADAYAQRPRRAELETEAPTAAPPAETPVADQPQTVLVFKDGHQLEVQNYAVIGDVLYDLTPGRHHKIPLADLDLTSTTQQNDDRGIDFRLPPNPETNK
jgi:hypothetical protein